MHLIVGVLTCSSQLRSLLDQASLDAQALKERALELIPDSRPGGTKRAIEEALRLAGRIKSESVQEIHILLGTLADPVESVHALFESSGLEIAEVRNLLLRHYQPRAE